LGFKKLENPILQVTAGDLPVLFRLLFSSSYQIHFAQKGNKNHMILFKDFFSF
jgi:hypothetical protein